MRKDVRKVLGLTLFLAAFTAACDNNPLKDDRDKGAYIFTNPSFSTIVVGDSVIVTARVMNKYTAPTGDAVTGTPCNSRITAVTDTTRTEFEAPERFVVRAVGLGNSCLVVTGGGVTDTIGFIVGPFSVRLTADTALTSGVTKPLTAVFRDAAGNPITGFDNSAVTFVSRDTTRVYLNPDGTITGRGVGSTYVVQTLRSGFGETSLRDSVLVNNSAAAFNGTVSPASPARGGLLTLTAGSVPFDADTRVSIAGTAIATNASQTATTITVVVPNLAATVTSGAIVISNMGPNQVSATTPSVSILPIATFDGTIVPSTLPRGGLVTLTAGSIPFDANTTVTLGGVAVTKISQTATTFQFVVPTAVTGTSAALLLTLLGPNDLSQQITVPVGPTAIFSGTAPANIAIGGLTTITGGADPFDADTRVTVNGVTALVNSFTATSLEFVAPSSAGTSAVVVLSNVGPNQLASTFTSTQSAEAGEPDNTLATARTIAVGSSASGTVSSTDADDMFKITLAAPTAITIDALFTGTSADVDVYILDAAGADGARYNCAGSANPEHCTYTLPAGTWYIDIQWFAGTPSLPYRLKIN